MLRRTRFAVGPGTCLQGEANIEVIGTHILDTVSGPASGFPPALGTKLAKTVGLGILSVAKPRAPWMLETRRMLNNNVREDSQTYNLEEQSKQL